jgi:hypothetical protein
MMKESEIDTGRIIAAYLRLRDEKHAFTRSSDAIIAEYDDKMDRLLAVLLKRMNAQGVKGLRSDMGIVIKQKDIIPTGSDWDAFYSWVAETNSFEALERRIKKTFIQNYMEENGGAIPPGVSVLRSYKAVVKKAPSKKGLPPDGEE